MLDLNETFLVECDVSKEVGTHQLMAHHLQSDASDIKKNSVPSPQFFIFYCHITGAPDGIA